jgi:drug/metabolite transporter (DMT)-like permease
MDLSAYRGELVALATAFCWTASALAFAYAAACFGSLALNIVRLAIALVLFMGLETLTRGLPLPTDATGHNWFWLTLSGLVGFTLGDLCLFRAFVLIGPRRTMLLMALVPMLSTLISYFAIEEILSPQAWVGMVLTIGGIAWVIFERAPSQPGGAAPASATGVLLALGAAVGQAGGLVLSKIGMAGYDAFASTQIRVIAGLAGFAVLFFVLRAWPRVATAVRHRKGMVYAALGACFGPFLGVSFSLMAVRDTKVGVASTIMSITPVLIIPFVVLFYGERVTGRAVIGAVVAVAGVAVLFL